MKLNLSGRKTLVVGVVCVLAGAAFGPQAVLAAKKAITSVFVTNTPNHPVPVKAVGTTTVGGTVTVATGKLDVSGSSVAVSGGKIDASGSTVAVSGGKIDASGSAVSVTGGKLDVSGSTVSVTPETPFEDHGQALLSAGQTNPTSTTILTPPSGDSMVIQYMTANVTGDSGATLPYDISLQDGTGSSGAALFLPLTQTGPDLNGSSMTQVLFPVHAVLNVYRATTTGNAQVHWDITGYYVPATS